MGTMYVATTERNHRSGSNQVIRKLVKGMLSHEEPICKKKNETRSQYLFVIPPIFQPT